MTSFVPAETLPAIPFIDVDDSAEPTVVGLAAHPERLKLILASARRTYTPLGMKIADALSRDWARRNDSPYCDTLIKIAAAMGVPGAYLLNLSYEWGCTTGAAADPEFGGATLMRVLDWPFHGLGRALIATQANGPAGVYISLTWPAYAGVMTGSARGRFAAAINQPPLPNRLGPAVGWLYARHRIRKSTAMPPSHLLRLAFETCVDFAAAVALIKNTPICIPATFTLAGINPDECLTIERTENQAFIARNPAAANHWTSNPGPQGRPRDKTSLSRHAAMCRLLEAQPDWTLRWLKTPIHEPSTRLVVMANPASGSLIAEGWESSGPATQRLVIKPTRPPEPGAALSIGAESEA